MMVPCLLYYDYYSSPPVLPPPPPEVGVLVGDDRAEELVDPPPTPEVLFRSRSLDEVRLGGVFIMPFFLVGVCFGGLVVVLAASRLAIVPGTDVVVVFAGAAWGATIVETLADTVRPRRDEPPRVGDVLIVLVDDDELALLVEDTERRDCGYGGCWWPLGRRTASSCALSDDLPLFELCAAACREPLDTVFRADWEDFALMGDEELPRRCGPFSSCSLVSVMASVLLASGSRPRSF